MLKYQLKNGKNIITPVLLLFEHPLERPYVNRRRLKTLIGVAMVLLGLVQAGSFAVQAEWIPVGLGIAYGAIGVAFLWAEVYAADASAD